jgi:hypothetical protein
MPQWELSGHIEQFSSQGAYTPIAVQRSFADATAIGDTTVIAAQGAGVKVRILGLMATSSLGINAFFKSGATKLSATVPLVANTPRTWEYVPHGWFETAANEAFVINQSLAANTGIEVIWVAVR